MISQLYHFYRTSQFRLGTFQVLNGIPLHCKQTDLLYTVRFVVTNLFSEFIIQNELIHKLFKLFKHLSYFLKYLKASSKQKIKYKRKSNFKKMRQELCKSWQGYPLILPNIFLLDLKKQFTAFVQPSKSFIFTNIFLRQIGIPPIN